MKRIKNKICIAFAVSFFILSGMLSFGAGEINAATTTSSLQVTSPNGGETLELGQTYRITWNSSSNIDTVWIGYSCGPGCLDWIATSLPNTGYYDWTPQLTGIPQAKIEIDGFDHDTFAAKDESDALFYINQPTPTPTPRTSLTVRSPNGGEKLHTGQTYRITWDSTSNINKVTLGYSFGPYTLGWIAYNIPNTGYYDWKVNVFYPTDKQVKIEVTGYSTNSGQVTDQSDNFFTVLAPKPVDTTNPKPGNNGYNNHFNNGFNTNYNNGYKNNFNSGYNNSFNNKYNNSYNNRFNNGYNNGYNNHFNNGFIKI